MTVHHPAHLYLFDGVERRELDSYDDANENSKEWVRYNRRHGGGLYTIKRCRFCRAIARHFRSDTKIPYSPWVKLTDFEPHELVNLLVCPHCGWYRAQSELYLEMPMFPLATGESAVLRKEMISDRNVPLDQLRGHLARNWGDRRALTPGQAEALVADVFKEHLAGEIHYVTNGVFAPDGGVDFVIVNSDAGLEYAFQVKRRLTDKPECVEEVRSFIGAMATGTYAHGYYVTTSPRFTRATENMIKKGGPHLQARGLQIDLVDGSRLIEILRNGACRQPSIDSLLSRFRNCETEWLELQYRRFQRGEEPTILSGGKLTDFLA